MFLKKDDFQLWRSPFFIDDSSRLKSFPSTQFLKLTTNFYIISIRYFSCLIPDFLVKYPLDNSENLKKVTCSTILFHGRRDGVIPFESLEILYQINRKKIKLIILEKEIHRSIMLNRKFRKRLCLELKDESSGVMCF